MRVAIGPTDPAGTSSALAAGLRSLGVGAEAVVWSPHPYGYEPDRLLGRSGRHAFALSAPLSHDVFHYQGFTWVRRFADALWARALRRTLVVNFHGDDCRLYGVARALFPPRGSTGDPRKDAFVAGRVEQLARICHAAIVPDLELATYVVPRFERVYLAPPALHEATAAPPAERGERPVVVHAPSDPFFKGTAKIEAAVRTLQQRMPLDFRLVRDVANDVALRELAAADVVVDQLDSVNVGIVALEAMRLGRPVLSQLGAPALAPYQDGLPVVGVTPETLADELETLVWDPDRRTSLGEQGRRYVERVHAPQAVAAAVVHVYEHARDDTRGFFEATAEGIRPLEAETVTIRERLRTAGFSDR